MMIYVFVAKILGYVLFYLVHFGSYLAVSCQHKKSVILLHPLIEVFGIPKETILVSLSPIAKLSIRQNTANRLII